MSKLVFAIGAALIAAGTALREEFGDPSEVTSPAPSEEPAKRGRGRPRDPEKAAAAAAEEKTPVGKTEDELRAAIKPLVEDGKGADVKKLVEKHGGTKLADIPAANHAAFIKDVEALSY